MSVSAKFKSDAHIAARRELEFREVQLQNQLRGDKNNLLKAQWEQKTENSIIKQVAKNRIADIKKRAESNLH